MPNLMGVNDVDAQKTLSNFEFSGKKFDELGAAEYTLACIEVDVSGSVSGYDQDLVKALENIVKACEKDPKSENMLVRVSTFNATLAEVHGFVPLDDIKSKDYGQYINPAGGTALYDATLDAIECTQKYGENLVDMDYGCNAILFIVTDGEENSSRIGSPKNIVNRIEAIRKAEKIESVKVILIGVGDQTGVQQALDDFHKNAKIDQYLWVGEATPSKLAKLAEFISQSISSTSQALGTGAQSQNLTF